MKIKMLELNNMKSQYKYLTKNKYLKLQMWDFIRDL